MVEEVVEIIVEMAGEGVVLVVDPFVEEDITTIVFKLTILQDNLLIKWCPLVNIKTLNNIWIHFNNGANPSHNIFKSLYYLHLPINTKLCQILVSKKSSKFSTPFNL